MNIQVPWIYIVRNRDLLSQDNQYISPNIDEELDRRQRALKDAIREEEEERRHQERVAKARRP